MIDSHSIVSLVLLSWLSNSIVQSRPSPYLDPQETANLSANTFCRDARPFTTFCDRCFDRGIHDKYLCITTELSQAKPDRRYRYVGNRPSLTTDGAYVVWRDGEAPQVAADAMYSWNGIIMQLELNIDSCKRVQAKTLIGPMDVNKKSLPNVNMQDIVKQVFSFRKSKDAVDFVRKNALKGREEVGAFLKNVDPFRTTGALTVVEELEADLRNSSIKLVNAIVFQAILGTAAWVSVQGTALQIRGGAAPSQEQSIIAGGIATLVLLTYLAIIDWLEKEIFGTELLWVLWIHLAIVSRMRRLISNIPPLPRTLEWRSMLGAAIRWAGSGLQATESHLGVSDTFDAHGALDGECPHVVADQMTQLRN